MSILITAIILFIGNFAYGEQLCNKIGQESLQHVKQCLGSGRGYSPLMNIHNNQIMNIMSERKMVEPHTYPIVPNTSFAPAALLMSRVAPYGFRNVGLMYPNSMYLLYSPYYILP